MLRPISALPCQINQILDSSRPNNCILYISSLLLSYQDMSDLSIMCVDYNSEALFIRNIKAFILLLQ